MNRHLFSLTVVALVCSAYVAGAQKPFITTWRTTTANESITIPTTRSGLTYNYTVNWGDGTTDTNNYTGDATHSYTTAGTHTVEISGTFPAIDFHQSNSTQYSNDDLSNNRNKILTVEQWGDIQWQTMEGAFYDCGLLTIPAIDTPDLSQVTDMSEMFAYASTFNQPLNLWDVSNVTDMNYMFSSASAFNQPLDNWKVNNVTDMSYMFDNAISFNQELNSWDVSRVTNMRDMFVFASAFNQELNSWDVSNVTGMGEMFFRATSFNQPLDRWDVSNVTNMSNMFFRATSFNQPLNSWNVSKVADMTSMLNSSGLSTQNYDLTLKGWNALPSLQLKVRLSASGLTYCEGKNARTLLINNYNWTIEFDIQNCPPVIPPPHSASVPENTATTATVLDVNAHDGDGGEADKDITYSLTGGADQDKFSISRTGVITFITSPDFENPADNGGDNVYNITVTASDDRNSTVQEMTITTTQKPFITTWRTTTANESITIPTRSGLTYNYTVNWGDGTSTTTYTGAATHSYATAGTHTVEISGTFPAIDFHQNNSTQYPNDDLSNNRNKILTVEQWGDIQWRTMESAFYDCGLLTIPATDAPDLSLVTSINAMFSSASTFNQPLDSWDVSKVTSMSYMFLNASAFNQSLNLWDVSNVTNMGFMFSQASAFNQPLDRWDVSKVTDMNKMFSEAVAFNQSLSSWDVSNVTNMTNMLNSSGLSIQNYDLTLQGWAALASLQSGVSLGASGLIYCEGKDARTLLINDHKWTISSDIQNCPPVIPPPHSASVPENTATTATVLDVNAHDGDGGEADKDITYSLTGGADQDKFSISRTGVITFITSPDFENPADNGGDNVYNITVTASDDRNSTVQEMTITTTQKPFITTWRTTTANESITIPTRSGLTYNYTVNWGDGTSTTTYTGAATHSYATAGTHTVEISGTFPAIDFHQNNPTRSSNDDLSNNRNKILTVEQWGDIQWQTMNRAFYDCGLLTIPAPDAPDLSLVTNMSSMFSVVSAFNEPLNSWDVSKVTDMSFMFFNASAFNQPLDKWDVSNVTNMSYMFYEAVAFNEPLDSWDVGKVTYMDGMFYGASAFNQPLDSWNVSNVTNMNYMFSRASAFNQPLDSWDVGKVTYMGAMFEATSFNQPLDSWNVSQVTNMSYMFYVASAFNQSLSSWNVSNVTNMTDMLNSSGLSTQNYDLTLKGWNALASLQSGVSLGASGLTYCEGKNARTLLINDYNWTIKFDIQNCPPVISPPHTASVPENTIATVLDVNANNGDGGGTDEGITYRLTGGADKEKFNINSSSGGTHF